MGKGRRSYTINTPALSLTPPRSSADHSYSVSPPEFIKSHLKNDMLNAAVSEVKPTAAQRRNSVAKQKSYDDLEHKLEATPLYVLISTYLNYFLLICFGHLRDILGKIFKRNDYKHLLMNEVYILLSVCGLIYCLESNSDVLLSLGICAACVRL
jgi:hypothetical protein